MKYGLHESGKQVGPIDPEKVNETGWSWYDSYDELEAANPPSLAQAKSRKLAKLKAAADAEVAPILAEYPEVEIKTWGSQEREARAWAADNNAATPTLSGISQTRGKSISYLADKVIQKADDYRDIASAAAGKRQALADAVEAATTVAEVEAINW